MTVTWTACGVVHDSRTLSYSRRQLIDLCRAPASKSKVYVNVLAEHGLLRYRGRRGGALARGPLASVYQHDQGFPTRRSQQVHRSLPTRRLVSNIATVIVGNRPPPRERVRRPASVLSVHFDRHAATAGPRLVFGCHNIRSVANKLDDVLEVRSDLGIDVLYLVETWHDTDSVSFRRLRTDGFQFVDRPRPRSRARVDTLSTNHGGVAVVVVAGVRLTILDLGLRPDSFELLCVGVASDSSSCVIVLIYRTGPVTPAFFSELSDVLDRVAKYIDPVFLVGDVNIRLDRADDPASRQFTDVLTAHGLLCHVRTTTHDRGGLLDVASRADLQSPSVDVLDVGLSDHRLLRWSSALVRPRPVYSTTTRRSWRQLDEAEFRERLLSSPLCQPDKWSQHDVDGLARMYDEAITTALDQLVPAQTVRCRRRPSDPCFDEDCRSAKRQTRRLERAARGADPNDAPAVAAERQ